MDDNICSMLNLRHMIANMISLASWCFILMCISINLDYTNNTAVMVDPLVNSISPFIFALKEKGGGRFAGKLWFSLHIGFYFVLVFLQNMRKLKTLANGSVLHISLSQHDIATGFQGREELLLGVILRWCIMCFGPEGLTAGRSSNQFRAPW